MENERQLTFIDEDGNEILCEILFTFESKEFNKHYVLFYPVAGEEDDIEVMAASYVPGESGEGELNAIGTDEEWDMIEKVLEQFEEDQEDGEEDSEEEECECCEDEECECCEDEECTDEECECEHDHENHKHGEDHDCCCKNHK
jgi:uncharacterized protein YrzB (UPF0473 family)